MLRAIVFKFYRQVKGGTSNASKVAPFRECYGRLQELRSLAPPVNILAVTAIATKDTQETIIDVLQMKAPYEIYESPEKPNITYVVEAISPDTNISKCFEGIGYEVIRKGIEAERTIIYCQTINQCARDRLCRMANVIINNMLTATVIGAPLYKGTSADPLSCSSAFSLPALTVLRIESRKILPLSYETVRDTKKDNRRKTMPSFKYSERRYFLVQFLEDNVKFIVVDETELQRKEDKTTQAMYLDKKYYPRVVLSESGWALKTMPWAPNC
ncbi:hypothetical protein AWC38_SpisGene458 [Stylophora pistillata]|uniref:Uncharacterized protein n=1 Tax=Stylophora pistillata TaxID=50429 RepID=A0A2B4T1Z5_STYPI|nr:hypothetical protein AWC38_SpisGene458 [Stylophora pistillata]